MCGVRRRLYSIAASISALLCAAVVVLWLDSHYHPFCIHYDWLAAPADAPPTVYARYVVSRNGAVMLVADSTTMHDGQLVKAWRDEAAGIESGTRGQPNKFSLLGNAQRRGFSFPRAAGADGNPLRLAWFAYQDGHSGV